MTDSPGWTSPGSAEPTGGTGQEAPAAPAPSSAAPTAPAAPTAQETPAAPAAPQPPADAVPPAAPGPYDGGYGVAPAAPTPPTGPAPYGGGPQPGMQPWGWGAPPSPKPGVIPLRPLGVGELLDGAFTTVRLYWRTALGLSLAMAGIVEVAQAVLEWWSYQDGGEVSRAVSLIAPAVLDVLFSSLAGGMMTMVVSRAVLGQGTSLRDAWHSARPQLLKLIGLTLLNFLVVAGVGVAALLPLFGLSAAGLDGPAVLLIVPAFALVLWIGIQLYLAAPALMLERQGVIGSMRRSWRLVRGSWWRTFGVALLLWFVLFLITVFAIMPFAFAGSLISGTIEGDVATSDGGELASIVIVAIGRTLIQTITMPIGAAATVLLYVDRRIRREALDIELARAAGATAPAPGVHLPGQTTPPGA